MDLSKLSTSELEMIASGKLNDLSTETLEMIAKSKPEKPSLGHELLAAPHGLATGLASTADLIDTINPARIIREKLGGKELPSWNSLLPTYEPKTAPGRILHAGSEFGGDMIGAIGIGKSIAKAGIKGVQKLAPEGAGLLKRAATAVVNTLKNPAELFGNPQTLKEAGKMTATGVGLGAGSQTLQEGGVSPLVADIASGTALLTHPIYKMIAEKRAYGKALNSVENQALRDLENQIGSENIDKVLKNLDKSKPSLVKGYEPSTAEVANNTALSQVHRAYESHSPLLGENKEKGSHVLRSAVEELFPENASIQSLPSHLSNVKKGRESNVKDALDEALESRSSLIGNAKEAYNPENTGNVVRKGIENKVDALERLRTQKTDPLYKAVEDIRETIPAQNAYDFIDHSINYLGVKNPVFADLLEIKRALKPNSLTAENKKILDEIENSVYSDKIKDQMKKELGVDNISVNPTPGELDNVKKLINEKIKFAKKSGDATRVRYLSQLKQKLVEDLEVVPEAALATKTYRQYSQPITDITGDRALKKAIDQDIYKNAYKIGPAEIPKLFTDSTSSIRNAQNLIKTLRNDTKTLNTLKEHLYQDFIANVVDSKGNVKISAIESWMKSHPGSSVLDPQFGKKLNSLGQAQARVDYATKQLKRFDKIHDTEAFKNVLGKNGEGVDSGKIIQNILSGNNRVNKVKEIINLTKLDKTGKSLEGFRHGVIDDILNKTGLSSINANEVQNISYDKLRKYMSSNKDALKLILLPEQMETLRNVENILKKRTQIQTVGKGTGSDTTGKMRITDTVLETVGKHAEKGIIKELLSNLHLGTPVAHAVIESAKNVNKRKALKLDKSKKQFMDQFLASPSFAKENLTKFKDFPKKSPSFSLSPTHKSALTLLGAKRIE